MNRARITAELPPDMAAWLATADPRTVAHGARDVAARTASRLLYNDGEGGISPVIHGMLTRDHSTAVRAVATALGCDETGAPWSARRVLPVVCAWFGLHGAGAQRDIGERLRVQTSSTHPAVEPFAVAS